MLSSRVLLRQAVQQHIRALSTQARALNTAVDLVNTSNTIHLPIHGKV